jgi:uncharacterized membrane protein YfcA
MTAIFYCVMVLFIGGALKGVVGLGLPQIGIPLLSFVLGLKASVGILVLPIIASNFTQCFTKGLFLPVTRRFWPLLATLFCVVISSAKALSVVPERELFAVIGVALIVFPIIAWFRPAIQVTAKNERWMGPFVGAVAGLLGGVSNLPGPPLMIYLACLRLPRDEFVVAVSLMFLTSAVGLGLGLLAFSTITQEELALSAMACIPVFLGMWLGNMVRMRMNESAFARMVLITYLLTGLSFLVRAL